MRRRLFLFVGLSILLIWCVPARGEEGEEQKEKIEATSPDGQFAFRYAKGAEAETYDLIDTKSGKVVKHIAESDPDLGPSARFHMEVLWRPDSKAFAVTETLWKRGSNVAVYLRDGSTFREIKLPKLAADIPAKIKAGKSYPHVAESDSESAKKWQADGSLVVEMENIIDGNDGSITATRTAVLGVDRSDKAKVLKSTIEFTVDKDWDSEASNAWDEGDLSAVLVACDGALKKDPDDVTAYYYRGCVNYVKRDWKNALADFERHCELRKTEQDSAFPARFYIWLLRARLGDQQGADKQLAPGMEGHPPEWSGGWDAKVGNFLLGKTSEEDFVLSLNDNPGLAWFYAGMKRLLNKDTAGAAEAFKKSMATGEKKESEYQFAAAELKAITK